MLLKVSKKRDAGWVTEKKAKIQQQQDNRSICQQYLILQYACDTLPTGTGLHNGTDVYTAV